MIFKREVSIDSIISTVLLLIALASIVVKFDHVEATAVTAQKTADDVKFEHDKTVAVLFANEKEITHNVSELSGDVKVLHQMIADSVATKHN
jgi:hypothetical protein